VAVGLLVLVIGDDIGVQGRSDGQRELLDAESVAGHLLGRGRPSVPADVMAAVITLQTLQGLSDSETVDAVTFDLRWKTGGCRSRRGRFMPRR
jgi:Transposase domain (DUF772)